MRDWKRISKSIFSMLTIVLTLVLLWNVSVTVSASDGTNWIDRVNLPDYARKLYNTLVEATDGDGVDDILITDESFSRNSAMTVTYSDGTQSVFKGIHVTDIPISEYEARKEELFANIQFVYDAFDRDHPEVFWLDGATRYIWQGARNAKGEYVYRLYFVYVDFAEGFDLRKSNYTSEAAIRADIALRNKQVEAVCALASGSDYEKIKAFNAWLTTNNQYNMDALAAGNDVYPEAWNCISALDGIGSTNPVCEGYARAFKVLCDSVGIPCILVSGTARADISDAGEGHMWNYVRLNGAWYAVDVTWNDPVPDRGTKIREKWLLLGTDSEVEAGFTFAASHITDKSSGFDNEPVLSTAAYNPEEGAAGAADNSTVVITTEGEREQIVWQQTNGRWFCVSADGRIITDWVQDDVSKLWYYMDKTTGIMQINGWFCDPESGIWYYLDANGAMCTSWIFVDNVWYLLDKNGAMCTGWNIVDGEWYYMDISGAMLTGWQTIGGKEYYLDATGKCLMNTITPDGYRVDANGVKVQ